jgi:hypothetical protein
MSKESKNKRKLALASKKNSSPAPQKPARPLTQAALLFGKRRPRRRLNTRFLVLLALWIVALILGLLYLTGKI